MDIGCLEKIYLSNFNLYVEGWTIADSLKICSARNVTNIKPYLVREELNSLLDLEDDQKTGFQVMVTYSDNLDIDAEINGQWLKCEKIRLMPAGKRIKIAFRALKQFMNLLVKCPKDLFRFVFLQDQKAVPRIKAVLQGNRVVKFVRKLNPSIFKAEERKIDYSTTKICIIIPVYNAFEITQQCLDLLIRHSDLPYRLVIIEDKSTDERVRPWLRQWVKEQSLAITLIENDLNCGFIDSVNKGFSETEDETVILLNTDALAPVNWLSRIIRPLVVDTDVASITPMSNDAQILSVPVMGRKNYLEEKQAEAIDRMAAKLNPEVVTVDLPTGVGYCMAMNAKYLKLVGSFDPVFKPGYGEEVDWCQKAAALGGRNVGIGNLFVEHRGGESFGSDFKEQQIKSNSEIIDARYNRYHGQVAEFISFDPMSEARFLLSLAHYAYNQTINVYFAHTYGGGSELYLKNKLKENVQGNRGAVVLREDSADDGYRIALHDEAGVSEIIIPNLDLIRTILSLIEERHFVYSALAGARNAPGLLENVLEIYQQEKDRLTILFHDYYPLCPSFNLLNDQGSYCNLPDLETCSNCYRSLPAAKTVKVMTIEEWRKKWGRILEQSDEIVVFSAYSRNLVSKIYPDVTDKIAVRPHRLEFVPEKINNAVLNGKLVIGVLGTVVYHKGAGVLYEMADFIDGISRSIVVFGDLDPRYTHKNIKLHGPYEREQISALAEHYQISCWLIPSIWPETFSYTTHEALATGLPVFGFDLGAQAEALKDASNGFILNLEYESIESIVEEIESIVENWFTCREL